ERQGRNSDRDGILRPRIESRRQIAPSAARGRRPACARKRGPMSLELLFHPMSSFCQKALIALYENDTPFTPHMIDLGDPASRAELTDLWPVGKFPVLRDHKRGRTVPESSIIIEYLAQHYPGKEELVPTDADLARQVRMRD